MCNLEEDTGELKGMTFQWHASKQAVPRWLLSRHMHSGASREKCWFSHKLFKPHSHHNRQGNPPLPGRIPLWAVKNQMQFSPTQNNTFKNNWCKSKASWRCTWRQLPWPREHTLSLLSLCCRGHYPAGELGKKAGPTVSPWLRLYLLTWIKVTVLGELDNFLLDIHKGTISTLTGILVGQNQKLKPILKAKN